LENIWSKYTKNSKGIGENKTGCLDRAACSKNKSNQFIV
jgi:hypothetical protein